jgi:DNA-binding SARP family transcriptional activator
MEYRILGPLQVLDAGNAIPVPGARERAVLAFLLLHARQVVPTDRLIDELWGEEPLESARKSLQVRVAGLRKVLGSECISTHSSGYAVHVDPDQLDLDRFQRLLAASDMADPAAAAGLLRDALELWRGPALVDFRGEPWAATPIARLEELRLLAVEKRIDADLQLGRHAELAPELEGLVGE